MIVEKMGRNAQRAEKKEAEQKARRAQSRLRNDTLLKSDAFCEFLSSVANLGGYFCAEYSRQDPWHEGYHAALRDLVNGIVMNSSSGAAWLRDYAEKKAAEHKKTEKN